MWLKYFLPRKHFLQVCPIILTNKLMVHTFSKVCKSDLRLPFETVNTTSRDLKQANYFSVKLFSVSAETETVVDYNTFDKVCEETLQSLTDYFEELCENTDELLSADISYSSGVLTVNLGQKYGTYVINRQTPNRQIWLSSPSSGPKRYDLVAKGHCWVYKHDGRTLHQLLQEEISKIAGDKVDFSKCLFPK